MSNDVSADAINDKATEIQEELAIETGVNFEDVGKILDRLGLQGALRNRAAFVRPAKYRLQNVVLTDLRIAAGDVPL